MKKRILPLIYASAILFLLLFATATRPANQASRLTVGDSLTFFYGVDTSSLDSMQCTEQCDTMCYVSRISFPVLAVLDGLPGSTSCTISVDLTSTVSGTLLYCYAYSFEPVAGSIAGTTGAGISIDPCSDHGVPLEVSTNLELIFESGSDKILFGGIAIVLETEDPRTKNFAVSPTTGRITYSTSSGEHDTIPIGFRYLPQFNPDVSYNQPSLCLDATRH